MSGIATRAKFALLDTRNGLDLDTYATFAELAAVVLYQHAIGHRDNLPWPARTTEAQRCDQLLERINVLAEETRQAVVRNYDPARLRPPEMWPWLDRQSGVSICEDRYYGFCDSGGLWGDPTGYESAATAQRAVAADMNDASWSQRPQDLGEVAVCVLSGRQYVDRLYEICGPNGPFGVSDSLGDYGNWSQPETAPARSPYMLATDKLQEALRELDVQGYVVTVEQRPKKPLAMGNYETVVSVRKARGVS